MTIVVVADSATRAARIEAALRTDRRLRVVVARLGTPPARLLQDDAAVVVAAVGAAHVHTLRRWLGDTARDRPLVLLTDDPHAAWTSRARDAGAGAILSADAGADELSAAIAAVRAGLVVLDPDVAGAGPRAASRVSADGAAAALTRRELQILESLADGLSNRRIARRLGISAETVKGHVASVCAKLGAANRTEAVTAGLRRGLVVL